MKRILAAVLSVLLAAPGCAMSSRAAYPRTLAPSAAQDVLAGYSAQLTLGARVRATVEGNKVIRGTLVKRTDTALVIQPAGRLAEPLVEVPMTELRGLELDRPKQQSNGRAIAVGALVGAGTALGILFVLAAALWSD